MTVYIPAAAERNNNTNSGLIKTPVVRAVQYEDDPIRVPGVGPPQRSDLLLATHVPHQEGRPRGGAQTALHSLGSS